MAFTQLICTSPIDDSVCLERPYAEYLDMQDVAARALEAAPAWAEASVAERMAYLAAALDRLKDQADVFAQDLVVQTGRPVSRAAAEIRQAVDLTRPLLEEGQAWLAPAEEPSGKVELGLPRGPTFILAPAEYPYLSSMAAVFAALLAGNPVILHPSRQAPQIAERYAEVFAVAGLPEGLFQPLNINRQNVTLLVQDERIRQVVHLGGPGSTRVLRRAAAEGKTAFTAPDLGWAAAYVAADAEVEFAAAALAEAAYRNAGQGVGAVKRILLAPQIDAAFIKAFRDHALALVLGDPRETGTTLGPMIRKEHATATREIVIDAFERGARPLIDPRRFPRDQFGTAYCAPQAMTGVTPAMRLIRDYVPGPLVGIATAADVAEASQYLDGASELLLFGGNAGLAREFADASRVRSVRLNRADFALPFRAEDLFRAVTRLVKFDLERA